MPRCLCAADHTGEDILINPACPLHGASGTAWVEGDLAEVPF